MFGKKRVAQESVPFKSTSFRCEELGRKGGVEDGFRYINPSGTSTPTYPTSTSAHDYDIGYFVIATQGQQASTVIGSLRVGFSGWLRSRRVDIVGSSSLAAHYAGTSTTANAFTTMTARTNSSLTLSFSALAVTINNVGRFLVMSSFNSATSYTGTGYVASGTATLVTALNNNGTNLEVAGSGGANGICTVSAIVDVTAAGGILTVGSPTVVGACNVDVFVVQIPSNLTLEPPSIIEVRVNKLEKLIERLMLLEDADLPIDTESDDSHDYREADNPLAQSVHIPRSLVSELLGLKSRK